MMKHLYLKSQCSEDARVVLGAALLALLVSGCGGAPAASSAPTGMGEDRLHDDGSSGIRVAQVKSIPVPEAPHGGSVGSSAAASPAPPPPPPPPPADLGPGSKSPTKLTQSEGGTPVFRGALEPEKATPASASTTNLGTELSEADVNTAIAPQLRALRACALTDSLVSMRLSLAPGGRVAEATATRSSPDDARLRDCVEAVFRGLTFHASSEERGTALSFELELRPLVGS